jgi:CDK inhibitor PHO81
LNATGFAKALKKWDKRSKSQTKELYLSRQVEGVFDAFLICLHLEVQPVFNRDVIAGLSDTAVSSLLEIEAWLNGEELVGFREAIDPSASVFATGVSQLGLTGLESDLTSAITHNNIDAAEKVTAHLSSFPEEDQRTAVTTVFLRAIPETTNDSLKFLLGSGKVDMSRFDEITDRGCLHEAALAGRLDVLQLCINHGIIQPYIFLIVAKARLSNRVTCMVVTLCTTFAETVMMRLPHI